MLTAKPIEVTISNLPLAAFNKSSSEISPKFRSFSLRIKICGVTSLELYAITTPVYVNSVPSATICNNELINPSLVFEQVTGYYYFEYTFPLNIISLGVISRAALAFLSLKSLTG